MESDELREEIAAMACVAMDHRHGGDECDVDYRLADALLARFPVLAGVPTDEMVEAAARAIYRRQYGDYPPFDKGSAGVVGDARAALSAALAVRGGGIDAA